MKKFAELWDNFSAEVIPDDAPAIQVEEMKKAFYGGGITMMMAMLSVGDDDMPEDEGISVIDALTKEMEEFSKSL